MKALRSRDTLSDGATKSVVPKISPLSTLDGQPVQIQTAPGSGGRRQRDSLQAQRPVVRRGSDPAAERHPSVGRDSDDQGGEEIGSIPHHQGSPDVGSADEQPSPPDHHPEVHPSFLQTIAELEQKAQHLQEQYSAAVSKVQQEKRERERLTELLQRLESQQGAQAAVRAQLVEQNAALRREAQQMFARLEQRLQAAGRQLQELERENRALQRELRTARDQADHTTAFVDNYFGRVKRLEDRLHQLQLSGGSWGSDLLFHVLSYLLRFAAVLIWLYNMAKRLVYVPGHFARSRRQAQSASKTPSTSSQPDSTPSSTTPSVSSSSTTGPRLTRRQSLGSFSSANASPGPSTTLLSELAGMSSSPVLPPRSDPPLSARSEDSAATRHPNGSVHSSASMMSLAGTASQPSSVTNSPSAPGLPGASIAHVSIPTPSSSSTTSSGSAVKTMRRSGSAQTLPHAGANGETHRPPQLPPLPPLPIASSPVPLPPDQLTPRSATRAQKATTAVTTASPTIATPVASEPLPDGPYRKLSMSSAPVNIHPGEHPASGGSQTENPVPATPFSENGTAPVRGKLFARYNPRSLGPNAPLKNVPPSPTSTNTAVPPSTATSSPILNDDATAALFSAHSRAFGPTRGVR